MKTKPKKDRLIPVLSGALALALAVMALALITGGRQKTAEFSPPPFDSAALQGTPDVPEKLGYSSPYREGMGYRFSVCANVPAEGNSLTVYLTNPAENKVWLKLRVLDEGGGVLGESGLVRPGEYVKDVTLAEKLPAGTKIKLKIMGYEPETYRSAGSAILNTTVGGESQ